TRKEEPHAGRTRYLAGSGHQNLFGSRAFTRSSRTHPAAGADASSLATARLETGPGLCPASGGGSHAGVYTAGARDLAKAPGHHRLYAYNAQRGSPRTFAGPEDAGRWNSGAASDPSPRS